MKHSFSFRQRCLWGRYRLISCVLISFIVFCFSAAEAELNPNSYRHLYFAASDNANNAFLLNPDGTLEHYAVYPPQKNAGSAYQDYCIMQKTDNGIAVAASSDEVVVLCRDGMLKFMDDFQLLHSSSRNPEIVQVAFDDQSLIALRQNGTVMTKDSSNAEDSWSDICLVDALDGTYFGLKTDGTVEYEIKYPQIYHRLTNSEMVRNFSIVDSWKNITQIAAGGNHLIGLKDDGTVVAAGSSDYGACDINNWKDIVQISTSYFHTIGLKADGTLICTNKDLRSISNGASFTDIEGIQTIYTFGKNVLIIYADGTADLLYPYPYFTIPAGLLDFVKNNDFSHVINNFTTKTVAHKIETEVALTPYCFIDAGHENGLFAYASGGQGMNINVTSNTDWQLKVTEGADWITLSRSSGSGSGSFYTTISPNSGSERTGWIELTAPGCETIRIRVVQEATPLTSAPEWQSESKKIDSLEDAVQLYYQVKDSAKYVLLTYEGYDASEQLTEQYVMGTYKVKKQAMAAVSSHKYEIDTLEGFDKPISKLYLTICDENSNLLSERSEPFVIYRTDLMDGTNIADGSLLAPEWASESENVNSEEDSVGLYYQVDESAQYVKLEYEGYDENDQLIETADEPLGVYPVEKHIMAMVSAHKYKIGNSFSQFSVPASKLYLTVCDAYGNALSPRSEAMVVYRQDLIEAATKPEIFSVVLSCNGAEAIVGERFTITVQTNSKTTKLVAKNNTGTGFKEPDAWSAKQNSDGTITWTRSYTAEDEAKGRYWTVTPYNAVGTKAAAVSSNKIDIDGLEWYTAYYKFDNKGKKIPAANGIIEVDASQVQNIQIYAGDLHPSDNNGQNPYYYKIEDTSVLSVANEHSFNMKVGKEGNTTVEIWNENSDCKVASVLVKVNVASTDNESNRGYEIAVVVDKKDVICDRYCFSPSANSYYFGLRAYYNGKLLNTTENNSEYKFIIPDSQRIDDYLCPYDFTINPATNYFTGFHKEYWLVQKIDAYTFRFNPNIDNKGIIELVDKNGKELADIQIVVRKDGRYVTGGEVGYEADEYLYDYEVLLPKTAYAFWDAAVTSIDAKRLWYDLQVQSTNNRIMSAIPSYNLEAFMEEYGDNYVLRFSVATNNVLSGVFNGLSTGTSIALRTALTGYLDLWDGATGVTKAAIQKSLDMDVTAFDEMWASMNSRHESLYDQSSKELAAFQGKFDKEAVITQAVIQYLNTTVPDNLTEVTVDASDVSSKISTGKKLADNLYKAFSNVLNQYLDSKIGTAGITVDDNDIKNVMEDLKNQIIAFYDIDGKIVSSYVLEELIDVEASRNTIRSAVSKWNATKKNVEISDGLTYTDRAHWLVLDQTYIGNRIYEKVKTLCQSQGVENAAKYGGEAISAILSVMKVYDTTRQYEMVLSQWEEYLTAEMNKFAVDSEEYKLYKEILSQLREGIENEVANTIFEVIKPFINGELGLKDIPTYVAKAFGVSLSLPVQLAKLGLTITIADNSGSKGKMWDMDTIYSSYSDVQNELIDALNTYKQLPSDSSFESIEALVAYYQMLRAASITTMEAIVNSDANRWSDTIVLSAVDAVSFPYRLAPAFFKWLQTGDTSHFSLAASRVDDKNSMKVDIAIAKQRDLEDMIYLDGYVFPLKESYTWIQKQAQ